MDLLKPAKSPCSTCPYRKDVPSGIWHESEYLKLPGYDGDVCDQLARGATGLFMCHQQDGSLCAGWVGCHSMENTLAVRLNASKLDDSVFNYVSTVPLFASGAKACAHGMKQIKRPRLKAQKAIDSLTKLRKKKETA